MKMNGVTDIAEFNYSRIILACPYFVQVDAAISTAFPDSCIFPPTDAVKLSVAKLLKTDGLSVPVTRGPTSLPPT
jgi:hypothetical protein